MFATILQQDTPSGIQQVAIVPMTDGKVREFIRSRKNVRGTAGAWQEIDPNATFPITGTSVGSPVSIPITANDYRDLQYPLIPTTLVQKLVRTVKDENTASYAPFAGDYNEVK